MACQGRDWQAGFGGPPGLAGGPASWPHQDRGWWAGVWRTRTGAGGQCVDAPGQRLVASVGFVPGLCWNRGMELAARLTGLMLGLSLAMSEACVWACQGGVVSTCSYVR